MSSAENVLAAADIESGGCRRHRRQRRRSSVALSSETTTDGDGSLCFSDSDAEDGQSWHSPVGSTRGGSFDECGFSEIERVLAGGSSPSLCSSEDVDLESGELETKVHSGKEERDCRICHLNLVGGSGDQDSGLPIELGCSCKGDLAAAHKQCADTWFKIRGNTTCEICGATALSIVGEQANEANGATARAAAVQTGPLLLAETRNFWHGRRVMNVLLACMVFAFVISWLFHFNVLS